MEPSQKNTIVTVIRVLPKFWNEALLGFNFESPQNGMSLTDGLKITGWVLGKKSPVVSLEFRANQKLLKKIPVKIERSDVLKSYPSIPYARQCGFNLTFNYQELVNLSEIKIRAVLAEGTKCNFAKIKLEPENTRKVAILTNWGTIPNSFLISSEDFFRRTGNNTGNIAYWYAVHQQIKNQKQSFQMGWSPKNLSDNFDVVVFPAANQIGSHVDMGGLAKLFEQLEIPIVVVGLGAQAPAIGQKIDIPEGTKKWLKVLSKKCQTIGLRGAYTGTVLQSLGIDNFSIIGCPSLFINPDPNLGISIQKRFEQILAEKKVGKVSIVAGHTGWPHLKNLEHRLFEMFDYNFHSYICQAPLELIKAARAHSYQSLEPDVQEKLAKYYDNQNIDLEKLIEKITVFASAEAWFEYNKSFSLSIGTRFHGNMFALQAGVPPICINHDSRLQELTTSTLMPAINQDDFMKTENIFELIEKIAFDGKEFDENRKKLAQEYSKILEAEEISISYGLNLLKDS